MGRSRRNLDRPRGSPSQQLAVCTESARSECRVDGARILGGTAPITGRPRQPSLSFFMRSFLARIFTRRFITRAAFVFACLATLIFVFYRYEAWRGRRAWEAYRAQAEQAGLKFDISAYLPPEVPEAEN